jgi:hypothetical protein
VPFTAQTYIGGPLFYAINKIGAQKALDAVSQHSFLFPVDHFLPLFAKLKTAVSSSMMAHSPRSLQDFAVPNPDPSDTLPLGISEYQQNA